MKNLYLIIGFIIFHSSLSAAQGSITGKVLDKETSEPVIFATVALYKDGVLIKGAESDFDGIYFFDNLSFGDYTIEADYVGYLGFKKQINLSHRKSTVNFDFLLNQEFICYPNVTVTKCFSHMLPLVEHDNTTQGQLITNTKTNTTEPVILFKKKKTCLSGKILQQSDSLGLIGANISLYKEDRLVSGTVSDLEGNYSVCNLTKGTYRMEVSYVGYDKIVESVNIKRKGNREEVNLVLVESRNEITPIEIIAYKIPAPGCILWQCHTTITAEEEGFLDKKIRTKKMNSKGNSLVKIFPNPTKDFVNLEFHTKVDNCIIYSADGRRMYQKKITAEPTTRLSNFHLVCGTYFVTTFYKGKIVETHKLIINNYGQ